MHWVGPTAWTSAYAGRPTLRMRAARQADRPSADAKPIATLNSIKLRRFCCDDKLVVTHNIAVRNVLCCFNPYP
jgi:hypothetical protein